MSRPVTLFTGQWADLPLAELAPLAYEMGYDGLELACWGDHFDVDAALSSKSYVKDKWELLAAHGLTCYAVSNHLVGQAVCDLIDERHQAILSPAVWGDGDPEGVRKRAAKQMIATGKAARAFFNAKPDRNGKDEFPAESTVSPAPRSGTRSTPSHRLRRSIMKRASRTLPNAGCRSLMPMTNSTSTSRSKFIRRKSPSTSPLRTAL